jgi:hypothetical protein
MLLVSLIVVTGRFPLNRVAGLNGGDSFPPVSMEPKEMLSNRFISLSHWYYEIGLPINFQNFQYLMFLRKTRSSSLREEVASRYCAPRHAPYEATCYMRTLDGRASSERKLAKHDERKTDRTR